MAPNAVAIARVLGVLLQTEGLVNSEPVRSYLRLKVRIDIPKPLSTGFYIKDHRHNRWVSFKYERLGDFRYSCGKLGHLKYDCHTMSQKEYMAWLAISFVVTNELQDGNEVLFRIKRNAQLRKLMYAYCNRQSVEFCFLVFMFHGRRLRAEETPDELEMEDGEEIGAMRRLGGGPAA